MRCPVCHSDTSAELPRCSWCNAALGDDSATAQDAQNEQWPAAPWQPEPWQAGPRQPEPWQAGPREGEPWQAGPRHGEPWGAEPWGGDQWRGGGPDQGEHTTSLSPEPWAQPLEQPPQMWQPPRPRSANRALPYFIAAGGGVLLVIVALAIIFWPGGGDGDSKSDRVARQSRQNQPAGSGNQPTTSETGTPQAKDQATKVDGLLNDMASTRSELGGVVTGGCETAGLERIRGQRQEQLRTARELPVDALDGGDELKDALVRALEASVDSNQKYLDNAPGCPPESAVTESNGRANRAKDDVVRLWGPVAQQMGLPSRTASSI